MVKKVIAFQKPQRWIFKDRDRYLFWAGRQRQPLESVLCSVPRQLHLRPGRTSQIPRAEAFPGHYGTFTFTFSNLADAFVQSDVQGREQSS